MQDSSSDCSVLLKPVVCCHALCQQGLFAKRRQLILTDAPRLYYIDPVDMELKGEIPWSDALQVEQKNWKIFFIHTVRAHTIQLTSMSVCCFICAAIIVVYFSVLFFHQCSRIALTTWRTPLETPKTGVVPLESGRVSTCNGRRNQLKRVNICSLLVCYTRLVILWCGV